MAVSNPAKPNTPDILDKLTADEAVLAMAKQPDALVGARFRKSFGARVFWGSVVECYYVDKGLFYKVSFDDGDVDIMSADEVVQDVKQARKFISEDRQPDLASSSTSPTRETASSYGDEMRQNNLKRKREQSTSTLANNTYSVQLWGQRLYASIVTTGQETLVSDFVKTEDGGVGEMEATGKVALGDIIVSVNNKALIGLENWEVSEIIRNAKRPVMMTFCRRKLRTSTRQKADAETENAISDEQTVIPSQSPPVRIDLTQSEFAPPSLSLKKTVSIAPSPQQTDTVLEQLVPTISAPQQSYPVPASSSGDNAESTQQVDPEVVNSLPQSVPISDPSIAPQHSKSQAVSRPSPIQQTVSQHISVRQPQWWYNQAGIAEPSTHQQTVLGSERSRLDSERQFIERNATLATARLEKEQRIRPQNTLVGNQGNVVRYSRADTYHANPPSATNVPQISYATQTGTQRQHEPRFIPQRRINQVEPALENHPSTASRVSSASYFHNVNNPQQHFSTSEQSSYAQREQSHASTIANVSQHMQQSVSLEYNSAPTSNASGAMVPPTPQQLYQSMRNVVVVQPYAIPPNYTHNAPHPSMPRTFQGNDDLVTVRERINRRIEGIPGGSGTPPDPINLSSNASVPDSAAIPTQQGGLNNQGMISSVSVSSALVARPTNRQVPDLHTKQNGYSRRQQIPPSASTDNSPAHSSPFESSTSAVQTVGTSTLCSGQNTSDNGAHTYPPGSTIEEDPDAKAVAALAKSGLLSGDDLLTSDDSAQTSFLSLHKPSFVASLPVVPPSSAVNRFSNPAVSSRFSGGDYVVVTIRESRLYVTLGSLGSQIVVTSFVHGNNGECGEIEKSGKVLIGDVIVAINGSQIGGLMSPMEIARIVVALARPFDLYFQRASWDVLDGRR